MTSEQERFIEELYYENFNKLMIFAMAKVRDQNLAQDLVQDTFHEAIRHIDTLRGHVNPGGWLMVTLKYKIKENARKHQQYIQRFLSLESEMKINPGIGAVQPKQKLGLDSLSLIQMIEEVLEPEEYRLLKRLTLDRAGHMEVAKEFNISVYASQKRLQRIREKLREKLPDEIWEDDV